MHRQAQRERKWAAIVLILLLCTPASAATPANPTPYDRAVAAGYKALTLCSTIFVAGRTQAQAEALELTGIYPEYDAIVATLPAVVGSDQVSVTFAETPEAPEWRARVAEWSERRGCRLLPIGSSEYTVWIHGQREPGPLAADRRPWPAGDRVAAPTPSAKLLGTVASAFAAEYGTHTRTVSVVVTAGGRLVAERYATGFGPLTANRTWSVAKSLSGTLIGIAGVKPTDAVAIPEWRGDADPRSRITWDDLLRMASGLHGDTAGNRTDAVYFGGTAVTDSIAGLSLEAKPGTRFRYANNDILTAVRGLREKLGDDAYANFPANALFARLGMTHTVAETDWRGNYVLSSQVWSTARDLARFGQLYLQDGIWNGQRLLPKGWVEYVTTPSGPQPEGAFGYGATFWLMNKSPGVPADTFAAIGNRGQYVVIVPSRRIVIVRRGEDPGGASFDIAKFTAEVLAVLK